MPFHYVLDWKKDEPRSLSVRGYYKFLDLSDEECLAKDKPAFEIGSVQGERVSYLEKTADSAASTYGCNEGESSLKVTFPREDEYAVCLAQRIGLTARVLHVAPKGLSLERTVNYTLNAPEDEVRYWLYKVLDRGVGERRAVAALCTLAGSRIDPRPSGKK